MFCNNPLWQHYWLVTVVQLWSPQPSNGHFLQWIPKRKVKMESKNLHLYTHSFYHLWEFFYSYLHHYMFHCLKKKCQKSIKLIHEENVYTQFLFWPWIRVVGGILFYVCVPVSLSVCLQTLTLPITYDLCKIQGSYLVCFPFCQAFSDVFNIDHLLTLTLWQ